MKLSRHILGHGGAPTFGRLVSTDGTFACVTLERSIDGDHPCIPAGTYQVSLGRHHPDSPHGYVCPVIDNVPGRTAIHIHIANRAEELLGCVAVGERESDDGTAIEQSGDAFRRLMTYLQGAFPFTLTIENPA